MQPQCRQKCRQLETVVRWPEVDSHRIFWIMDLWSSMKWQWHDAWVNFWTRCFRFIYCTPDSDGFPSVLFCSGLQEESARWGKFSPLVARDVDDNPLRISTHWICNTTWVIVKICSIWNLPTTHLLRAPFLQFHAHGTLQYFTRFDHQQPFHGLVLLKPQLRPSHNWKHINVEFNVRPHCTQWLPQHGKFHRVVWWIWKPDMG